MKKIKLSPGIYGQKYTLVDDEDFEELNKYQWYSDVSKGGEYVIRVVKIKSDKKWPYKTIIMSRVIMKTPQGMVCDHINGNTLDNRKENLRNCTIAENCRNTGKYYNNISGYKGVYWSKCKGKWRARLQFNKKRYDLGYFKDKITAAKAYDKAARKYHGEFAYQNIKTV